MGLRHAKPKRTISQMFVVSALDSILSRDCMKQAQFQRFDVPRSTLDTIAYQ